MAESYDTSGVISTLQGGAGGFGSNGASGGDGANASYANQITGGSDESLILSQTAIGGNSGGTDSGPTGGIAGTGNSQFFANFLGVDASPLTSSVTVITSGQGGNGVTGDGAAGTASVSLNTVATDFVIEADARLRSGECRCPGFGSSKRRQRRKPRDFRQRR